MAFVVITLRVMPETPDINLDHIQTQVGDILKNYGNEIGRAVQEPIAFGLKALMITFVADENKGSTDPIEADITKIPGVQSVECTDARRTIG